ncbi:hypothetical protein RU96_GL001729 [Enterococcus canintestini]|uniref:Transposase n=1 Tax=Enterococcus canintestini TaxID=317010 RepID=A0A1L8R260_9ENTE|nr:hypothetical protein RU96_GL001729 [Enterococcus canintestini]
MVDQLSKYSETPADFVVGMEATGHYWLSIFRISTNQIF